MYTLKIKNSRGEIYELTHNRGRYSVVRVTGLTRPQTSINTVSGGTQDGEVYSSSHMNRRNIVITLVLEGDIEANRQMLYTIFPAHSPVTVYYRTKNRDLYIDGYVEVLDGDLYDVRCSVQISVICPDPYFRSPAQITAETDGGTCTIDNCGDVPAGFAAEVEVHAEDEPTLTRTMVQSDSPSDIRAHTALLAHDGSFWDLDLSTQTLNIRINDVLQTPGTDYTAEVVSDGSKYDLYLQYPNGSLINAALGVEVIKVDGLSLTDMRYWQSGEMDAAEYAAIVGVPGWFDEEKDCIVFAYTYGEIGRKLPKEIQKTLLEDGTYRLDITFYTAEANARIRLWLYHSMGGTDVHDAVISRKTGLWLPGAYSGYITNPTMPAYDSTKDILNVYKGSTLLTPDQYELKTWAKQDSSTMYEFSLKGGAVIDKYITFEVISSINGDDIREYTQTQLDDGLCIVDGLTLTNVTTGESMSFPDIPFRDGDKIGISTVRGDLHVRVLESDWMAEGTSLVREVLKSGEFFELEHGKNVLTLTADTNADYASASFALQPLYGGV